MSRVYKELPSIWRLQELLELTDEHPSGLKWVEKDKFVTRRDKPTGYYMVSIDNEVFLAHRVVYYLRTGECPDNHAVVHEKLNTEKDNRLRLIVSHIMRPQRHYLDPWS
jgi:hypothetical protein